LGVDFLGSIEGQDENDYRNTFEVNFFDAVSAKFGVEGFSGVLANDVKPFGVEVIIVEPGAFRTDWTCLRSRTGIFAPAGTVSLCAGCTTPANGVAWSGVAPRSLIQRGWRRARRSL
jgi:hypothetical protein